MNIDKNKIISWATIGMLAYMISDVIHEVVGHGGTCLLIGNRVTLLTSVYFKSQPGNIFVDIGGPLSNLVFVALTLVILKIVKTKFNVLLLIHILIYNFFWFSGTILHSAISKTGDWTFAIKELNISYEKYILLAAGVLAYIFGIRVLSILLNQKVSKIGLTKQDFTYPFLFASISAFITGLFFASSRLQAGLESGLEMAASIPILFLQLNYSKTSDNLKSNYIYSLTVSVLYIAFCLILGRGISN